MWFTSSSTRRPFASSPLKQDSTRAPPSTACSVVATTGSHFYVDGSAPQDPSVTAARSESTASALAAAATRADTATNNFNALDLVLARATDLTPTSAVSRPGASTVTSREGMKSSLSEPTVALYLLQAMTRSSSPPPDLPAWVDDLQARGRYTFTRADAVAATGNTEIAVAASLRRLRKAGRIVSPRRGFHAIVPLEYRATGAPPAEWFIDDLMRHLGRPYYVGLLSAAALYGAAHHAPQVFQVVTDVPTRPLTVGRRVVFVQGRAAHSPTETMNTATGTMRVSTPEATALDLVRHATASGGLQNVAGVLRELAERLDGERLVDAARGVERTVAQRLGWLLDHLGAPDLADPLARVLAAGPLFPAALRPDLPDRGLGTDPRWGVIANATIEDDE